MQIRPLYDRVVIRRLESEEKTLGGIIIPSTAQEKPMEGEVIAAGPGARAESGRITPMDLQVGDRVLFGKWSGTEVKLDGEDVIVMRESDVMGIIASAGVRPKLAVAKSKPAKPAKMAKATKPKAAKSAKDRLAKLAKLAKPKAAKAKLAKLTKAKPAKAEKPKAKPAKAKSGKKSRKAA